MKCKNLFSGKNKKTYLNMSYPEIFAQHAKHKGTPISKVYSRTSMARTPLGPWKIVRAMGSSSQ